jgi:general secretion pathway protein M
MAKKLTRREKYAVCTALGAISLFVLFQFIVFPLVEKKNRLERSIQVKTEILENMAALKLEYEATRKENEQSDNRYRQREKDFTLFSFLDKLSGSAGIKKNITYMKPSTTTQKNSPYKISQVEMKLQGLTLQQLTTYLHMIETSRNMVYINKLSILKTGKDKGFVDAVLQVETSETVL